MFNVLNFNDTLTNDFVSFEQPGPDLVKVVNIFSWLRLYGSVQLFLHIPYDPTKHIYMLRKYFIKKRPLNVLRDEVFLYELQKWAFLPFRINVGYAWTKQAV